METPLRSMLFVPANHARHANKALTSSADGVILDLEDAVAVNEKPAARAALPDLLHNRTAVYPRAFVRINALSTPFANADLQSAVWPGLTGIVLPKANTAADIAILDWFLTQIERERALPTGGIEILPIIETAAGITAIKEIATAAPRVKRLIFGAGDFSLDTGMTWTVDNPGLVWARVQIVVASRSSNLAAPLDSVFPNLADEASLAEEATQAKGLGFGGKTCIHPQQISLIHQVFTPTPVEIARAQRIVRAFSEAEAQGLASLRIDDMFVDYPIAAQARLVLELANYARQRGESV